MMSADRNVELMRKAYKTVFSEASPETCAALLTPDFIINLAGMPYQMRGRDAWMQNLAVMRKAFPDAQAEIEDIFGTGDRVAVRLTIRGTHTGEFVGIPATGRTVEYTSIEHYRVSGDLIAEEWICSDMLTLMRQIGDTAPH
jgi:steroid delta-isomerase-like uncharacterized protein